MRRIRFSDFVAEHGQAEAALRLGITQGAVSKALRAKRDVHVNCHEDGTFTAEEIRSFPSQPARISAA